MKEIEWRTPNRMLMESGHKTFDKQTDIISTGNIIAKTQLGFYVRAYTETECNGFTQELGKLQEADLDRWRRATTPSIVMETVRRLAKERDIILYRFFHYGKYGTMIVHGYIITTATRPYERLWRWCCGPTYKSKWVLSEVLKYITG